MRKAQKWKGVGWGIVLAILPLFALTPPPRVGTLSGGSGEVTVQRGKETVTLHRGDPLFPGDRIKTGKGEIDILIGNRRVILGDATTLDLKQSGHADVSLELHLLQGFLFQEPWKEAKGNLPFLLRYGNFEILPGNAIYYLIDGEQTWELGIMRGTLKLSFGGKRYTLDSGWLWEWDPRHGWYKRSLPFTQCLSEKGGQGSDLGVQCVGTLLQFPPGASNAPRIPYPCRGGGCTIRNDDPRSFIVQASLSSVYRFLHNHPPRGGGWEGTFEPNMITWRCGNSLIKLGITPTGVSGYTAIYLHSCWLTSEEISLSSCLPLLLRRYRDRLHRIRPVQGNSSASKPAQCFEESALHLPSNAYRNVPREQLLIKEGKLLGSPWSFRSYDIPQTVKQTFARMADRLRNRNELLQISPLTTLHGMFRWRQGETDYAIWIVPNESGGTLLDLGCRRCRSK